MSLAEWLSQFHHLDPAKLRPHLYSYPEADAVRHMLRVAGGLDSMILGEPQILGQMKEAYQAAADAGTLDAALSRLFQHTFSVAKQIRTDTAIGESPVSVAFAAVSLAKQIFGELRSADRLADRRRRNHRTGGAPSARTEPRPHDRRQPHDRNTPTRLAAKFEGYRHRAGRDPRAPGGSGYRHRLPPPAATLILDKAMVKKALKSRKHRPMFMVDIAVPRDIDAGVGELDDVYLYYRRRPAGSHPGKPEVTAQAAAKQAEEIIDVQVEHFMAWLRSQDAVPTIRDYRLQRRAATRPDAGEGAAAARQWQGPEAGAGVPRPHADQQADPRAQRTDPARGRRRPATANC